MPFAAVFSYSFFAYMLTICIHECVHCLNHSAKRTQAFAGSPLHNWGQPSSQHYTTQPQFSWILIEGGETEKLKMGGGGNKCRLAGRWEGEKLGGKGKSILRAFAEDKEEIAGKGK